MRFIQLFFAAIVFSTCTNAQNPLADLIVVHATIYTVDHSFSTAQAMVIKDGKILATGSDKFITSNYKSRKTLDARGNFIYPGFIDAHCHFVEYGMGLNECDLSGTESWAEVIQRLKEFSKDHPEGWLIGRGWDQNDWNNKSFPSNDTLNILFSNRPVWLTRIDGHAAIGNNNALKISGINGPVQIAGGEVLTRNNIPTGIFIDNARALVENNLPAPSNKDLTRYMLDAQQKCFAAGLTSVHDCGLDYSQVLVMDSLQKAKQLLMRVNAMLSDKKENYDWAFSHGKIKTDHLNVRSFKLYADGALGSRGACLLKPYNDYPNHFGFLLSKISYYDSILPVIQKMGWQVCTHAIGDSANRLMLKLYSKVIQRQTDHRWRIEHAQVINEKDFDLFGKSGIIPSVQPTHATSDMYWAKDRLGEKRVKGAYAYRQLLLQNGWIPLGTDFPVEDISPIKTFYAAVARKDIKGWPSKGFQPENALNREQALRGMTLWAAKAAFEEKEKGSLEKGKFADFIILNQDLMKVDENKILDTKVLATFSSGINVYKGEF
jgi:predicted amidohydrolase YtcJ